MVIYIRLIFEQFQTIYDFLAMPRKLSCSIRNNKVKLFIQNRFSSFWFKKKKFYLKFREVEGILN